jgi:hypothetical protein
MSSRRARRLLDGFRLSGTTRGQRSWCGASQTAVSAPCWKCARSPRPPRTRRP